MRPAAAGFAAIHQTLTPEAAGILNQSIAEAVRRNHGQTTPLHVAAALLASPSGFLRQACIRSHPNSSHPLQCRALELCFSVALERLATAQAVSEPPLSNALVAALKRAQANHRRGYPDQPPPLLAARVDLDQLIVSMLDDPSVSRVMREAGFSTPAVKSTIERSTTKPNTTPFFPNPNTYHLQMVRDEQLKGLLEIMLRIKKRNPILVGDSDPRSVLKPLLAKLTSNKVFGILNNIEFQVITCTMEKSSKNHVAETIRKIEDKIGKGGIVVDFGDLKWLVDQSSTVVAEMSELLARFRRDEGNKLWFIGTATSDTYLRFQVHHPTIETDWDLQAVPVASPSPVFRRLGVERLFPIRAPDSCQRTNLCSKCSDSYERELAKLEAIENSFSFSPSLPRWLQTAKLSTDESRWKEDHVLSLQKKWQDNCLHLHPNFHLNHHFNRSPPPMLSMTTSYDLNPFSCPVSPTAKPPGSPVRTDLVLGRQDTESNRAKDSLHCISSFSLAKSCADDNTYKKLIKGLMKMAWWQAEAAPIVASAIAKWKSGNGKRQGTRGDMWLLFTGPDRVGKKKMAMVLAEHIHSPCIIMTSIGTRRCNEEAGMNLRGKTVIDRIAEAIQGNPFSVILLEDIDEMDVLVHGSINSAIERGRFVDSYGREVSLGNTIFILTGDWSTIHPEASRDGRFVDEAKLASVASRSWQLGLIVREKSGKRRTDWSGENRNLKPRKDVIRPEPDLSLDLGLTTVGENADGSHNSSSVTIDHREDESFSVTSVPHDLIKGVDECVVFKPVELALAMQEIKKGILLKFSCTMDGTLMLEIEDDVLERILGGLWHDEMSLDEWIDNALEPSFDRLKLRIRSGDGVGSVVRLVVESDVGGQGNEDWLPRSISV